MVRKYFKHYNLFSLLLVGVTISSLSGYADNSRSIFKFYNVENPKKYIQFQVNQEGNRAFVSTNEHAYVGDLPMRILINKEVYWPLEVDQVIPAKWHVGSTTGDCYFDISLQILENYSASRSLKVEYTIPDYVSAGCASIGINEFTRTYRSK